MTRTDLERHMRRIKWLGVAALVGLALSVGSAPFLTNNDARTAVDLFLLGAILWVPLVFYLVVFTVWHWKSRYRGNHSDLWGALLVIEVSGWFKLIYFFRHAWPDARRRGRYASEVP